MRRADDGEGGVPVLELGKGLIKFKACIKIKRFALNEVKASYLFSSCSSVVKESLTSASHNIPAALRFFNASNICGM